MSRWMQKMLVPKKLSWDLLILILLSNFIFYFFFCEKEGECMPKSEKKLENKRADKPLDKPTEIVKKSSIIPIEKIEGYSVILVQIPLRMLLPLEARGPLISISLYDQEGEIVINQAWVKLASIKSPDPNLVIASVSNNSTDYPLYLVYLKEVDIKKLLKLNDGHYWTALPINKKDNENKRGKEFGNKSGNENGNENGNESGNESGIRNSGGDGYEISI